MIYLKHLLKLSLEQASGCVSQHKNVMHQIIACLMVILMSGTPALSQSLFPPEFSPPPPGYPRDGLPTPNTVGKLLRVTDEYGRIVMDNGSSYREITPDWAVVRGGDLVEVGDAAMTAASCTLTSLTAAFVAGDVGKNIDIKGADTARAILQTTIATYVSSSEVTTTDCAVESVSPTKMQFFTDFGPTLDTLLSPIGAQPVVIIERDDKPYGLANDITVKSNKTLIIRGDVRASWQNWPTQVDSGGAQMVDIDTVTNAQVIFDGGSLDGQSHENNTGNLIGIRIDDSSRLNIMGRGVIREMPGSDPTGTNGGDGITITGTSSGCSTKEIFIGDGLVLDANVRQGMSVICAEQLRVHAITVKNTSGTNPGAGIDFEPNVSTEVIKDVSITESSFINNLGGGIIIGNDATKVSLDVRTAGNYFSGNGNGTVNTADVMLRGFSENAKVISSHFRCKGICVQSVDSIDPLVAFNTFTKARGATASAGWLMYATGGTIRAGKFLYNSCRNLDLYCGQLDMRVLGSGTIDSLQWRGNTAIDVAGAAQTNPMFWARAKLASVIKKFKIDDNDCIDTRSGGDEADDCIKWEPSGGTDETGISASGNSSEGTAAGPVTNLYNRVYHTVAGITAFAGGGQAKATQLTGWYSEISTVATTGDSVKAPTAEVGTTFSIRNSSGKSANVFPFLGDNLGAGVNAAVALAAGASVEYRCYDRTNCRAL